MKVALGLLLGFVIGIFCRYAGVPLPAPPALPGALLVLSMTIGFLIADRLAGHRPHTTKHLCGGPTGKPASEERKGIV